MHSLLFVGLLAGGETYEKSVGHLVPIASAELYTP